MPAIPRSMRSPQPRAGARTPAGRRAGRVTFGVLNFKSIASAELEPNRLTIVAGSNSSGKSSLLQALLFCAQSFGEPTPVINGDLVRLGEANDLIRDGMEETTLEFAYVESVQESPEDEPKEIPRALRVTLMPRDHGRSLAAHSLSLWRHDTCVFKALAGDPPKSLPRAEEERALRVVDPEKLGLPDESFLIIAGITPTRLVYAADPDQLKREFEQSIDGEQGFRWPVEEILRLGRANTSNDQVAARLTELMHQASRGRLGKLSKDDYELVFEAFRELEAPGGWVNEPLFNPSRTRAFWRVRRDEQEGTSPASLARSIALAVDQVERLAAAVLYLGPLRDDPRVAYPLGHTVRALPVGEKGEFTAAYLRENRGAQLKYGRSDGAETFGNFTSAVNHWCNYLGIASQIEVKTEGKLGHVLDLNVGGRNRDPTAIGVGASQLLPVVVMVLGAPEGAIVLLEQPELHLHPGVQSRLADFLAYARRDIRVVVETHSEYLITRLRLRVAEGKLPPAELGVLFATQEPDEDDEESEGLHTEFEHLNLDELGDFNRWPAAFFDSLSRDSVDLANAVARKLQVEASDPE